MWQGQKLMMAASQKPSAKNMSVQENEFFFSDFMHFSRFFGLFPDVEIILCHTILAFTMTNDLMVAQNFSIFRPYIATLVYQIAV